MPDFQAGHKYIGRLLLLLGLCLVWTPAAARAEAPPPGHSYTFQHDDSLPRLADKFFNDPLAWPAIVVATNAQAERDGRFTLISDPEEVRVGQLLWIVELAYVAGYPRLQPLTAGLLTGFEDYIESTRLRYRVPGAVVVLIQHNRVVFARGFGVRQAGQPEPVRPDTIFPVGSTTKAMTSMMMASLVDEGRLDWDRPVVEIWPEFSLSDPGRTAQIQVRHLLNMGSGLPRRDLVWSGAGLTAEELVESVAELPVYGELGRWYAYNNQLFSTGGYLAAVAAGGQYGQLRQGYIDQLQSRVLDPIGMSSATTSIDAVLANPNRAAHQDFNLFGEVIPTHNHVNESITPAGGVYANALDMARFLITELNEGVSPEGRRVVSAENLAETHRPQTEISEDLSYGMGWFIEDYRGVEILWHDGNVFGFKALLTMIPSADTGMVLLSNAMLPVSFHYGLQYRLVELLFDLPPEAETAHDQMWDSFQRAIADIRSGLSPTVDPAQVSQYVGPYTGSWYIELRDNQLFARRGPYEWHLLQAGPGEFVVSNGYGIGMELLLEEDAETGRMTMSFRLPTGEVGKYELLAK